MGCPRVLHQHEVVTFDKRVRRREVDMSGTFRDCSEFDAGPVVVAMFGLMVGVQLAGCPSGDSRACDSEADCFAGEMCQNGVCTNAEGDTGRSESDGRTLDSGKTDPRDTLDNDGRSDLGVVDSGNESEEDSGDTGGPGEDGGGGTRAALGEPCGSVECEKGTCIEGTCVHVIAVTNEGYSGDLNGVEGADQKCRDAGKIDALERSDGGNWKALISTGDAVEYAQNRISTEAAVYNANTELFAEEGADIWGSADFDPENAVAYRLDGTVYDGFVWTGSGATGEGDDGTGNPYPNCDGWTSSSGNAKGEVGDASWSSSIGWIFDDTELSCSEEARLYCINGQ